MEWSAKEEDDVIDSSHNELSLVDITNDNDYLYGISHEARYLETNGNSYEERYPETNSNEISQIDISLANITDDNKYLYELSDETIVSEKGSLKTNNVDKAIENISTTLMDSPRLNHLALTRPRSPGRRPPTQFQKKEPEVSHYLFG